MSTGWQNSEKPYPSTAKKGSFAPGKKSAAKRAVSFTLKDSCLIILPFVLSGILYLKLDAMEKKAEAEQALPTLPANVAGINEARIATLEAEIKSLQSGIAALSRTMDTHEGVLDDLNTAISMTNARQAAPSATAQPKMLPQPSAPQPGPRFSIAEATKPIMPKPDGTMDFSEFADGYFDNPTAYDTQYLGKIVILNVKIQSVERSGGNINPGGKKVDTRTLGDYFISCAFSAKAKTMECYFPSANSAAVLKLKNGDSTLVKGRVLGKGLSVYLAECEIITR